MSKYKLMPAEPTLVAWVTADTVDGQTVNGKPRRIWWENNEGVGIPIYSAPQPAPEVATQILSLISDECRYWHGRDEARRGGYAILHAKVKDLISKSEPAPEVAKLVEALKDMIDVAEMVDSWERFPSAPLERAEDAILAYRKQCGDL